MHHEIYIDESCQNGHKFMVLGGVVLEQPNIELLINDFNEIRASRNLNHEIKWGKISNNKLDCYKAFIDVFFNHMNKGLITFHSIVIDCSQLDHSKYNGGDHEIGFSKFTYLLLLRIGKECKTYQAIHTYLDNRNSNQSLNELKTILNSGIAKKHSMTHRPFKRVHYIDSKTSDFVQAVDLLIGAIGYKFNGRDLQENASKPRIELLNYISQKSGVRGLNEGTPFGKKGFTIWKMRFDK